MYKSLISLLGCPFSLGPEIHENASRDLALLHTIWQEFRILKGHGCSILYKTSPAKPARPRPVQWAYILTLHPQQPTIINSDLPQDSLDKCPRNLGSYAAQIYIDITYPENLGNGTKYPTPPIPVELVQTHIEKHYTGDIIMRGFEINQTKCANFLGKEACLVGVCTRISKL